MSLSSDISTFRDGDTNPLGKWLNKATTLEMALTQIIEIFSNENYSGDNDTLLTILDIAEKALKANA